LLPSVKICMLLSSSLQSSRIVNDTAGRSSVLFLCRD
jgi:hypothetical protein